MRPPRLRCTLFPLIYPPHLLVLPATFGLRLHLQTYPYFRTLHVSSVRRTKSLHYNFLQRVCPPWTFLLTMDTLAAQLYTSSLPRRVRDFHPLECAHGAQTNSASKSNPFTCTSLYLIHYNVFLTLSTLSKILLIHIPLFPDHILMVCIHLSQIQPSYVLNALLRQLHHHIYLPCYIYHHNFFDMSHYPDYFS